MNVETAWNHLREHTSELETIGAVSGLLGWDQQVNMPPKAGAFRGEQLAVLSKLIHTRRTSPKVGEWLDVLEGADLTELQAAGVRNLRRDYDRSTKLSEGLVERIARAESAGFEAWVKAKNTDDFATFEPHLATLVELTKERAAAISSDTPAYDVLLESFDPGTTTADLRVTFARLRTGLVELLDAIRDAEPLPAVTETFHAEGQLKLHTELLESLGYDLQGGRLDAAEHPFTIGLGPGDVRITTHIHPNDLLNGLGSTIHEAGHGMYEQGLPVDFVGTGVRSAASLGLHESQSRFWENFIGRSLPFFRWLEPRLRGHFPGTSVGANELYAGANRVVPGLIRVEADEVTYNLHIIVRFELELALMEGRLDPRDMPDAWNEKYKEYLGITPPSNAKGCLQDVHWASGAFGYFPSYTLGNLYASSLGVQLQRDLPSLWDGVGAGEFGPILSWLREKVHHKGHLMDAPEIVRAAVGERDSVEDLLTYLWGRHGAAYGVTRP